MSDTKLSRCSLESGEWRVSFRSSFKNNNNHIGKRKSMQNLLGILILISSQALMVACQMDMDDISEEELIRRYCDTMLEYDYHKTKSDLHDQYLVEINATGEKYSGQWDDIRDNLIYHNDNLTKIDDTRRHIIYELRNNHGLKTYELTSECEIDALKKF